MEHSQESKLILRRGSISKLRVFLKKPKENLLFPKCKLFLQYFMYRIIDLVQIF